MKAENKKCGEASTGSYKNFGMGQNVELSSNCLFPKCIMCYDSCINHTVQIIL